MINCAIYLGVRTPIYIKEGKRLKIYHGYPEGLI